MAYKIAVGSSDGMNVNLSFGNVSEFLIYEVDDTGFFHLLEKRAVPASAGKADITCVDGCESGKGSCGNGPGGCGTNRGHDLRLSVIEDCRCILCKKIGFQARKQMEKKAISAFDIEYEIKDALEKIIFYFDRVDKHQTLRGIQNNK